mgnify:CR=1 FL=1
MVFSHYNPHEHNLQILRDRTLKFDARLKVAFLYDTEEEKALFDQLNFAYIGGRYRNEEEFPVTQTKIDFWRKEVELFLELTERLRRSFSVGAGGLFGEDRAFRQRLNVKN